MLEDLRPPAGTRRNNNKRESHTIGGNLCVANICSCFYNITVCDIIYQPTQLLTSCLPSLRVCPSGCSIDSACESQFDFPFQVHKMLEETAAEGHEHIVSWLPNGMGFRIHRREEFSKRILPRYFSTTKIRSFLRQLNIYSFIRVDDVHSDAYGAYWHKLFTRGNPTICFGMKRTKKKNNNRCNNDIDLPSIDKAVSAYYTAPSAVPPRTGRLHHQQEYPVDDMEEEVDTAAGLTTMLDSAFLAFPPGRNGVLEEEEQQQQQLLPACNSRPTRDGRFDVSKDDSFLLPSADEHHKGHSTNSLLITVDTNSSSEYQLEDDDSSCNPFDESGWNYYYPELVPSSVTTSCGKTASSSRISSR
jgi:hypothetical protein